MCAPASIAARATTLFTVSTESGTSGKRRASAAHHRHHSPQFLFGGDAPARSRPRRLAADVEDVGAFGDQSLGARDGIVDASRSVPPSLKLSGVTLTMPMTSGRSVDSVRPRTRHAELMAGR